MLGIVRTSCQMDLQKTGDQVQTHELCCIHLCGWTDMGWDDGQPCLLPVNFLRKEKLKIKKSIME